MQIYFICSNITLPGGTERAITTTINLLKSVEGITSQVVSLSSKEGDPPYFNVNTDIIHCSLEPLKESLIQKIFWYKHAIKKVNEILHDINGDDIIFSYGHNVSIMMPFIFKKNRVYACEHINYNSIPKFSQICMRLSYPYLNGIIALSATAKTKLKRLNKNIYIIPNSAPFKVDNHIGRKDNTIIVVGRISPEKGLERVVPIAKELKTQIPNWKIDIWGDGQEFNELQKLYQIEQIDDFVNLKGSTKDINSVYEKGALLIMTSYTEALPMVIIEANTYGIPVVAYECEGTLELINNGVNGFLIKNNDYKDFVAKILKIISDEETYNHFSTAAIKESQAFSEDEIRFRWLNLISK